MYHFSLKNIAYRDRETSFYKISFRGHSVSPVSFHRKIYLNFKIQFRVYLSIKASKTHKTIGITISA